MDVGDQGECLRFEARLLEAKKWKTRLFIAHQCKDGSGALQVKVYKKGKLKKTISLVDHYGIESGALIHGESLTLSIICAFDTLVFAFDDENSLLELENWLRSNPSFGCCFHCYVLSAPGRSGLQAEQYVRLHLQDGRFCLVAGIPGSLMLKFLISDLQCYGAVQNKFCFQVKCGHSSACPEVYVLRSSHCQKMDAYFSLASGRHLHYFLLRQAVGRVSGEKGDKQRRSYLNESRGLLASSVTARQLSFSHRLSGKELRTARWQKQEAGSSLSLNNETHDAYPCDNGIFLVRMYSDSQLGSPPMKVCHRCLPHRYMNQAFMDSLEYYDNCKLSKSRGTGCWKSSETVGAETRVGLDQWCHDRNCHVSSKRSGTSRFMPRLPLSRRPKRTFVNEKYSAQSAANEEDVSKNWSARHPDSKSNSFLVASEQNDPAGGYRDGRQMRLSATLGDPMVEEKEGQSSVQSLACAQTGNRHQSGSFRSVPVPASSPLRLVSPPVNSTPHTTCAKLWETKLNSTGTRRRLRATLSSYIRGSFSCYDGDCPDEVPMVSSAIVPQEKSSSLSKSACLLKAPLSAPCLPQHATVFDFPSSTVAGYREIAVSGSKVVKSKSNSLPCHGSRQKKLCNYVHIDMVATQAARKIACQRAEEFTGQSLSASMLSGSEGALVRKKPSTASSLAVSDLPG